MLSKFARVNKYSLVIIILVLFLLPASRAHALGLSKAASKLGLVGYWPMNEGTGTKAGDFSGNDNTGTLTGTPTWVKGKLGSGLNFTGYSHYVQINDANSLDATSEVTLSAWINLSAYADGQPIISKANNYQIQATGGNVRIVWYDSGTTAYEISVTAPSANAWHHIVGVVSGDLPSALYIDGVLQSSTPAVLSLGVSRILTNDVFLGTGTGGGYIGSIDEARIYNRALSAAEIVALYKTGAATYKTASNTGLVSYWPMNDGAGTVAGDFSGNGNTGTMSGFASPNVATSGWIKGKLGKALMFDGSNDMISITDSTSLNLMSTTTTTFASWIYITAYPVSGDSYIHQIIGDENSTCSSVIWRIGSQGSATYNKRIGINFRDTTDHDTQNNTDLPLNTWTHIAVTTDGSNARFYINGVIDTTNAYTITPQSSSCAWNIGVALGPGGRYFQGAMDDLRLYNRTLSATQIAALAKVGAVTRRPPNNLGLVGYWSMNDGAGTVAGDFSGNRNDGTLTNMASPATSTSGWGSGKFGKSLNFDGTDDYVYGVDSSVMVGATAATVSAWMYLPSTPGSAASIIRKDGEFTPFQVRNAGPACPLTRICFIVWGPSLSDSGVDLTYLPTGRWFQITTTWTSGGTPKLYIDGVFASNYSTSITGTITNSVNPLVFGATESGTEPFTGKLDEIRMYNRALSEPEVWSLYNYGI